MYLVNLEVFWQISDGQEITQICEFGDWNNDFILLTAEVDFEELIFFYLISNHSTIIVSYQSLSKI